MKNINNLVTATLANNKKVEESADVRFMLVISEDTREKLRSVCEELGVKQIKFASELFDLALTDTIEAIKQAKKAEKKPETAEAK